MARKKHLHPAGRASVFSAVAGIILIAIAVIAIVPVVLGWPKSWPGLLMVIAMAGTGIALLVIHMSRHRRGDDSGYVREEPR